LLRGMLAVRVSSMSHLSFAHILRVDVFGQLSFISPVMDCGLLDVPLTAKATHAFHAKSSEVVTGILLRLI
jgi:hypothetical protein